MTRTEQLKKRDELVAEQRKINLAIKILKSDSIPMNEGVKYALIQYQERLKMIDSELRALAEQQVDTTKEPSGWTIQFDNDGVAYYPTCNRMLCKDGCTREEVLTWNDMNAAKSFAEWYASKYDWKIVPIETLPRD